MKLAHYDPQGRRRKLDPLRAPLTPKFCECCGADATPAVEVRMGPLTQLLLCWTCAREVQFYDATPTLPLVRGPVLSARVVMPWTSGHSFDAYDMCLSRGGTLR